MRFSFRCSICSAYKAIIENESSCRGEKEGMFWRLLQKIMIDKTERHFDVNLDELKDKIDTEKEK